ncbi:uncharacterized protein LOC120646808 isoform X2 [Panicum virgatum]|uniref:uncharacterized protein LOC120646808 isoform X2 n=1 Tax=Panicum virgatum TaxID=38727 RepID=UPI0019D5E916|nr:uncharacterized protein LOC120646808 isoform X2 [Panicum virgatum]
MALRISAARAALPLCTSSAGPVPRATPARLQWPACCLGEEKRWQEQLGREESMVQQLNKERWFTVVRLHQVVVETGQILRPENCTRAVAIRFILSE